VDTTAQIPVGIGVGQGNVLRYELRGGPRGGAWVVGWLQERVEGGLGATAVMAAEELGAPARGGAAGLNR
jgi:hypothetical protein